MVSFEIAFHMKPAQYKALVGNWNFSIYEITSIIWN